MDIGVRARERLQQRQECAIAFVAARELRLAAARLDARERGSRGAGQQRGCDRLHRVGGAGERHVEAREVAEVQRERIVDRETEHHPRDRNGRAQRHGDRLIRHIAERDHAQPGALERRPGRRHDHDGTRRRHRVRRAHDDLAVEVDERRDGRPDSPGVVDQRRANGLLVAAGDRLLEPVVRDEHVHGRRELLSPVAHVLVEQRAGETDRPARLRVRVALDRIDHRKQRDELAREHERDREHQHFVPETQYPHEQGA
jgi:hypothetical protein